MRPALNIIDDFLPQEIAQSLRDEVLESGFEDVAYMKGIYQGSNLTVSRAPLAIGISEAMGAPVSIKMSAFRLGHKETDLHTNIHADNPISEFAAVYYMNLPQQCFGGTAFYRHKPTDWQEMPTQEQLDDAQMTIDDMRESWGKEKDWDMISLAGMRWNRMITYPTKSFHSRYPLKGWGDKASPKDCRLICALFFDILPPQ